MATLQKIEAFTSQKHIAVAGISRTPHKFGNSAFKELKQKNYVLYPISQHLTEFEGTQCYTSIDALPSDVTALLICTKPEQSRMLLTEARTKGIRNIWLQQGAADKELLNEIKGSPDNIITGECILMYAQPAHFMHRTHAFFKKLFGQYPKTS
jgi:uncharacterized protein